MNIDAIELLVKLSFIVFFAACFAFAGGPETCQQWRRAIFWGVAALAASAFAGELLGLNVRDLLLLHDQPYVFGSQNRHYLFGHRETKMLKMLVTFGYALCLTGPLLLYRSLYDAVLDKQRQMEWEEQVRKSTKGCDEPPKASDAERTRDVDTRGA